MRSSAEVLVLGNSKPDLGNLLTAPQRLRHLGRLEVTQWLYPWGALAPPTSEGALKVAEGGVSSPRALPGGRGSGSLSHSRDNRSVSSG